MKQLITLKQLITDNNHNNVFPFVYEHLTGIFEMFNFQDWFKANNMFCQTYSDRYFKQWVVDYLGTNPSDEKIGQLSEYIFKWFEREWNEYLNVYKSSYNVLDNYKLTETVVDDRDITKNSSSQTHNGGTVETDNEVLNTGTVGTVSSNDGTTNQNIYGFNSSTHKPSINDVATNSYDETVTNNLTQNTTDIRSIDTDTTSSSNQTDKVKTNVTKTISGKMGDMAGRTYADMLTSDVNFWDSFNIFNKMFDDVQKFLFIKYYN